jgi:hypothetical protein
MSGIVGQDPFSLLGYQQGQISAPLENGAADGADNLDQPQRAITIGEPVPIVFGRRVGAVGGVFISPGATEARFENSLTNEVTAYYHLVLSEGELDPIQVRDVFQRSCRVGTHSQSYDRRAGSWLPGDFIVERVGYDKPECPYYCGGGGVYDGLTTAGVQVTAPDGDDRWNRQWHFFIRGGMHVTRLLDSVTGASNNFADLAYWLLQRTSRVPASLIDVDALEAAAAFTQNTGLLFNGEIKESSNFEDFLANHARYFLLDKSKRNGKIGLRPLLQTTNANAISTDPVVPVTLFDESRIVPDSVEISYVPLAERKPFCALMLWRQQPSDDIGLIRTTEVRYSGTAPDGPYEQHDLSGFACSELHAVRVGAYALARRRYITHTLRFRARPSSTNQSLSRGDVVQVTLQRKASSAAAGVHNYFYEIDRIGKARNGELSFDLVHFPVDSTGRSLVARDVLAATPGGILLPTGKRPEVSCDTNDPGDTTTLPDDGLPPEDWLDPDPPGPGDPGGPTLDPLVPGEPPDPGTPVYPPPPEGLGPTDPTFGDPGGDPGGGEEGDPGDGAEEGGDGKDAQTPIDVSGPPPNIPVGDGVPQAWLDKLNDKIAATPEGQVVTVDWGVKEFTVTVQRGSFTFGGSGGSNLFSVRNDTFNRSAGSSTLRFGYQSGPRQIKAARASYQVSTGAPGSGGPYVTNYIGPDLWANGGSFDFTFYTTETIQVISAIRTA